MTASDLALVSFLPFVHNLVSCGKSWLKSTPIPIIMFLCQKFRSRGD